MERLKLLVEEIEGLEKAEIEEKNIRYWNEVKYGEVQREKRANVLKFYENKKDKVTEFMWITSILITEKTKKRWFILEGKDGKSRMKDSICKRMGQNDEKSDE